MPEIARIIFQKDPKRTDQPYGDFADGFAKFVGPGGGSVSYIDMKKLQAAAIANVLEIEFEDKDDA